MDAAGGLAHVVVRGGGHGAGVEHDQVGLVAPGGRHKSPLGEEGFQGHAVGLSGAASEVLDEKRLH